jgi:hypothetical protein
MAKPPGAVVPAVSAGSTLRSTAFGVVSVALHAGFLLAVASPLAAKLVPPARAEPPPTLGVAWAGNTLDVELVLAAAQPEAGKGLAEAKQATAESIEALPAVPDAPPERPAPAPVKDKQVVKAPNEPPVREPIPKAPADAPYVTGAEIAKRLHFPTTAPKRPTSGAAATSAAAATRSNEGADGDGRRRGGQFGAEGKSVARDLGHAFARAIGPANQADAAWSRFPTGPFGTLEIAIDVDESGKVGEVVALSSPANAQLLSLARRTVILLRGGVFHLRGAEATAGRAILRLRAEVSDLDATGANVQGGSIDLAFSYENGKGKAAFTREGGRHVEIFVTSLRTEPTTARSL